MLLEKLSLCNYGVYAGNNDFDLTTTPEKPIVLVGGFNGAGKTTILESMMIVLYGKSYFGSSKSKKEYLSFIYNKIHRSNKKRADSAHVEMAFRFYHNGSEDHYIINRNWNVTGASVRESFSVKKNDEVLDDVNESQWQAFIEGLLPLGIAKLFFFDGEKIIRVTENDTQYNKEIKKSLDTLIGADLVHQLHADLNLYMLRKSGSKDNPMVVEYEESNRDKNQITLELKSLEDEQERKAFEIEELKKQIDVKESVVLGMGGGYANMRGELFTQKAVLEEKKRFQEKQIHVELSEGIPFYLIPSLLQRIKKGVLDDIEFLEMKQKDNLLKLFTEKMRKKINNPEYWSDPKIRDGLYSGLLELNIEILNLPSKTRFFAMSSDDTRYLLQTIDKIQSDPKSMFEMFDDYADTADRIEKTESDIVKVPKDDEIGSHISNINDMHHDLGMLNAEITHIDQQIASKKAYLKILRNQLKNMIRSIQKSHTESTGIELASKMQDTLDTYYANLKEKKIQKLEANLLDTARLLLHKKFIRKIEIDRETFEIKAYENDTDQIPGDFLSMGERQIVGTALLWAIARTCDRSLPFVIDTPLGRLDGQHLLNLVDRFYPYASHQIILLSTDREIGQKEYKLMSKKISRSYQINCDQERSITSVIPGYFTGDTIAQVR